jgi:cytochrome c oxidase assembly factor CtaG
MDTRAIVSTFAVACVVAVLAFIAHRRLAGSGERPGLVSMIAFVIGWLALLLALITGVFLASSLRSG